MAEYTLYCFAQSGNAYKAALAADPKLQDARSNLERLVPSE